MSLDKLRKKIKLYQGQLAAANNTIAKLTARWSSASLARNPHLHERLTKAEHRRNDAEQQLETLNRLLAAMQSPGASTTLRASPPPISHEMKTKLGVYVPDEILSGVFASLKDGRRTEQGIMVYLAGLADDARLLIEYGVPEEEAAAFVANLEKRYGHRIPPKELEAALERQVAGRQRLPWRLEQRRVREALQRSGRDVTQVDRLINAVRQAIPNCSTKELCDALERMDTPVVTSGEVSAYIKIQRELQRLGIDQAVETFRKSTEHRGGQPASYTQLEAWLVKAKETDAFNRALIASKLNMRQDEVEDLMAYLQQQFDEPLAAREVAAVVSAQPTAAFQPAELAAELKLRRLAKILNGSFETLAQFIGSIEEHGGPTVSLEDVVESAYTIKSIDPNDLAAYFHLRRWIKRWITPNADRTLERLLPHYHDRHFVQRLWNEVQRLQPQQGITSDGVSRLATIVGSPASSSLLPQPDEQWLTATRIGRIHAQAGKRGRKVDIAGLKATVARCWRDIGSTLRRYQVPSHGNAEIEVSASIKRLIPLDCVRIVQEGVRPPGVWVRFHFMQPMHIGIVRINENGTVEAFLNDGGHDWFSALVIAIAFCYYRDLLPIRITQPHARR